MHLFRTYTFRPFWLFVYLFVVQVVLNNVVLCLEHNGNIAIGIGACPCSEHQSPGEHLLDPTEIHITDSCRDVVIEANSQFYPQHRQSLQYWATEFVHPLDQAKSLFALVSIFAFVPNYDAPSIHPSVRTVVLLI